MLNLTLLYHLQDSQAPYIPDWLECHRKPVKMILRLYSSFILFWDFCIILVYFALQMLRSLYQFVKPPKRKSVAGEIVAVSIAGALKAIRLID